MKVFLDANVIISVLNKEYPLFVYSARIFSLCSHKRYDVYTSPICLAISFYFASKKSGEVKAKQKINKILEYIKISTIDNKIVKASAANPSIHDFEDGIQYYSAIEEGCKVIITEDIEDYYFSEIEVLNCEDYLRKYVTGQR